MIVGKGRFWICATLVVVVGLLAVGSTNAALFGLWKSSKKAAIVPKQYLVVFPFDQVDITRVPLTFGEYVASDLRSVLSGSDRYNVLLYRGRLSPIARALADNTLRPADATAPFAEDRPKTSKLAQLLASDFYVVGSVDDFQVDSIKKVALITLSAELVDSKSGKLIKTLVVTGRTPENVKSADEEELRDLAKGDAVTKLCAELLAPKKTGEPGSENAPSSPSAQPTSPAPPPSKSAAPPSETNAPPPSSEQAKNIAGANAESPGDQLASPSDAPVSRQDRAVGSDLDVSVGFGLPYGVLGANVEKKVNGPLAVTAGVGSTMVAGMGWNVGARYYLSPKTSDARLTVLYGTNTVLKRTVYTSENGFSVGLGNRTGTYNYDVFYCFRDVPSGYVEQGSPIKMSLGYNF